MSYIVSALPPIKCFVKRDKITLNNTLVKETP